MNSWYVVMRNHWGQNPSRKRERGPLLEIEQGPRSDFRCSCRRWKRQGCCVLFVSASGRRKWDGRSVSNLFCRLLAADVSWRSCISRPLSMSLGCEWPYSHLNCHHELSFHPSNIFQRSPKRFTVYITNYLLLYSNYSVYYIIFKLERTWSLIIWMCRSVCD
jgi:hypothetical protein